MVNGNGSCRFRLQAPVACRVWGLGVQGLGVEGFGVLGFRGVGVYCLGFGVLVVLGLESRKYP